MIKTLSPQIKKNEHSKRKHKNELIKLVKFFLEIQLGVIGVILIGIIIMIFYFHCKGNDIDLSYIETIIKFVSVYITSVVIELVALLKYIVTNVFDTSIAGLVEAYKDVTKDPE